MRTWMLIPLLSVALLSGCVSAQKHKKLESEKAQLDTQFQESEEARKAHESKISELQTWITELENRLGRQTQDRKSLEASLSETKKALEEMMQRRQQAEARIKDFQALTKKFKALVDAGRLSVRIVEGRMVVGLQSDILFPSGSAKLSPEGTAAIREVGQVLATLPDRTFQIEGHTDNVPIQTSQFPSNWELANARALTVLNVLLETGVAPQRVSAASFGEFKPSRGNDTKENRAANRRIEIVIVPDLSNLPGFEELNKLSDSTPQ